MWILCKILVSYDYIDTSLSPKLLMSTHATLRDVKLISCARLRCDGDDNNDVEDDDMGGYAEQQARKFVL